MNKKHLLCIFGLTSVMALFGCVTGNSTDDLDASNQDASGTDVGINADTDAGINADTDAGINADTDAGINTDTDTDSDPVPEHIQNLTEPLIAFNETNGKGTYKTFELGYYRDETSTSIDGKGMKSFLLKKGHMLTVGVTDGIVDKDDLPGVIQQEFFDLEKILKFKERNLYIANTKDLMLNIGKHLAGKVNWMRVGRFKDTVKKGICTSGWEYEARQTSKAGWWYYWQPIEVQKDDADFDNPNFVQFVPMFARKGNDGKPNAHVKSYVWENLLAGDLEPDSKYLRTSHLLGLNEPELPNSGAPKFAWDTGLKIWPILQNTGMRLGSPASIQKGTALAHHFDYAAKNNWFTDFVAYHWYDYQKPGDLDDGDFAGDLDKTKEVAKGVFERFKNDVEDKHNKYGLPIWITEFNIVWSYDRDLHLMFYELVHKWLEETDYIERYCWYEHAGKEANLFWPNKDDYSYGAMTEFGKLYADKPSKLSMEGQEISRGRDVADSSFIIW